MRSLSEVLNNYNETGNADNLPDVTSEYYLRVNSKEDGWRSLSQGGHLYVIKQTGSDYAIYQVHNNQYDANLTDGHDKPQVVDGFYLDDVPKVLTLNGYVYFEERDLRSSFDITHRLGKLEVKGNDNVLNLVLQAFYAYANSVYQFSNGYETSLIPPVEIGNLHDTKTEDTGKGSTGSNNSSTPSSTADSGSGSATPSSNPSSAATDKGNGSTANDSGSK